MTADRAACRTRVEQQGDVWPLIESDERKSA
jgi:hypothetical protein